ncbi:MAG: PAS domain-containing protein [Candidatus Polarisedimenticolaceae bacterium]|nr:PAS domain-containing protein [Candidatus Polarisedimenticolaceae bacterium]
MSEFLSESKIEALQEIIRALSVGKEQQQQIQQFNEKCDSLTSDEVSKVFDQLHEERIPYQDNAEVLTLYQGIISEKLAAGVLNQFAPGHPARVYLEENRLIRSLFAKIRNIHPLQETEAFKAVFQQICKVEKHFVRKENQLFPCLEKHGWDSPSKNMWAFHDEIRAKLKEIRIALEEGKLNRVIEKFPAMESELIRLLGVEEERLLPKAMELLDDAEWEEMRTGDEEIGWMSDQAPPHFPAREEKPEYQHPSEATERPKDLPFSTEERYHYDEGYMTPEQVNLLFRHMPVDITYVDENDKVVFYNRGDDRVFPRSAGIIGREVRNCHPPKSVDTVLRILEEFKKGTQNVADFWINMRGRFILIRYFAIRDEEKRYRGVLEMSQDVTNIRALEGEQRLLDWEE